MMRARVWVIVAAAAASVAAGAGGARATAWQVEEVEARGFQDLSPRALAAAGDGVYLVYGRTHLVVRRFQGDGWGDARVVDPSSGVGSFAAAAAGPDGALHVVYYDRVRGDLRHATDASGDWAVEVVDETGDVGRYATVAVDPAGAVHAAYYDATRRVLRYARKHGDAWVLETADPEAGRGRFASIALTADDRPVVAYHDAGAGALRVAVRGADGTWTTEVVDDQDDAGRNACLAVGPDGTAYVAYAARVSTGENAYRTELRLAWGGPGGWQTEVVESDRNAGEAVSLRIGDGGVLHLAYRAWELETWTDDETGEERGRTRSHVVYAAGSPGSWSRETRVQADGGAAGRVVAVLPYPGALGEERVLVYASGDGDLEGQAYLYDPSALPALVIRWHGPWAVEEARLGGRAAALVLDPGGTPHAAYVDEATRKLRHAVRTDQGWAVEDVADAWPGAERLGLGLLPDGRVVVAYPGRDEALDLAWRTADGRWVWAGVTDDPRTGRFTSLAVAPDGAVHLAFSDEENLVLAIATVAEPEDPDLFSPAGIEATVVRPDGQPDYAGWWASAVLDDDGTLHVAHMVHDVGSSADTIAFSLLYGANPGGAWAMETVDAGPRAGEFAALALTPDGTPHVAYFDGQRGALRLASRRDDGWSVETVDADGYAGLSVALAADARGFLHAVYQAWGPDLMRASVRYANNTSGAWRHETVAQGADLGAYTAIAVAGDGTVHLVFQDRDAGTLRYARSTTTQVGVSPASVDLGTVAAGQAAEAEITLSNPGPYARRVSGMSLTGSDAFTLVVDATDRYCGSTTPWLDPGRPECVVAVRFAPSEAGAASGTLTIAFDDPDLPDVQVALAGQATAGQGGGGDTGEEPPSDGGGTGGGDQGTPGDTGPGDDTGGGTSPGGTEGGQAGGGATGGGGEGGGGCFLRLLGSR